VKRVLGRAGAAALILLACSAQVAIPTLPPELTTLPSLSATVIERYADALAKLERPKAMIFEYSVEQSGLHPLEETHRIYRSGLRERDETLVADGVALKIPAVRVVPNSAYKYDVLALAPKPADYTFVYTGKRTAFGRQVFAFRTNPVAASRFAVSDVLIDAQRYLPLVIAFSSASANVKGKGRVQFGASGRYWVAREASVSARAGKKDARERIRWTRYRFPDSLPEATFAQPRPVATDVPALP
jgi:hypothetical protein